MKRAALRITGLGVMFVCIAAPAPGNVGGCGGERRIADIGVHCRATNRWKCFREQAAERITTEEYNACLGGIDTSCSGSAWPLLPDGSPCEPSVSSSNACINILSRADLFDIPTEELLLRSADCDLCE